MKHAKIAGAVFAAAVLLLSVWPGLCQAAATASDRQAIAARGVPIQEWVGKTFLVLALSEAEEPYGYDTFTMLKPSPAWMSGSSIRHEKLEEKQLVVKSVVPTGDVNYDYVVTFMEKSSGVLLKATSYQGCIPHLMLLQDYQSARSYFIGKTVYSRIRILDPYYEPGGPADQPGVAVGIDTPLKVLNVVPHVQTDHPIALIVQTPDKKKAMIMTAYSLTNVQSGVWSAVPPWRAVLLEQDPRRTYDWTEEAWAAIKLGTVFAGMNADQVRLAWGDPYTTMVPDARIPLQETWLYPTKQLLFDHGTLVAIQDR